MIWETTIMAAGPGNNANHEPVLRETGRILAAAGTLLTPGEVAQRLRVTPEQVRCLIRRGQLAAVNVGTGPKRPLYRITPEAVEEFLSGRSRQTAPPRPTNRHLPVVPDFFPDLR
jgi:excisionase family DNA binding protein